MMMKFFFEKAFPVVMRRLREEDPQNPSMDIPEFFFIMNPLLLVSAPPSKMTHAAEGL